MADVQFIDHTLEVQGLIESLIVQGLEESAGELKSLLVDITAVDTGQLRGSWSHTVNGSNGHFVATVGSPLENAIWEEFGTGEYALNGDGRKGGWGYEDPKTGETVFTRGKHPKRPFHKAYTIKKNTLIQHVKDVVKRGLSS